MPDIIGSISPKKNIQGVLTPQKNISATINDSSLQLTGKLSNTTLRGYSAYDVAVLYGGFEGTEEEWLASLKGETGETGADGRNGLDGRSITNVVLTTTSGNVDTYTIYYSDGTTSNFLLRNGIDGKQGIQGIQGIQGERGLTGEKGEKGDKGETGEAGRDGKDGADGKDGVNGRGISSIVKTSSADNVDTYTITYTDNTTSTYTITNGTDGKDGINGQNGSDGKDGKDGKDGTSVTVEVLTNTDSEYILRFTNGTSVFTTPNLRAVADLTDYATKEWVEDKNYLTTHQSLNGYATETWVKNQNYLTEHQDISSKANTSDLATVATSGSYNDLTNKPSIPTVPANVSAFNNDAGYLTSHQSLNGYATENWVENQGYLTEHQDISGKANTADLATVATTGDYDDLSNKPTLPTVPTKVSDLTNDSGYMTGLTFLSYGNSSWADFLEAYTNKQVVYCRASSNSNPASGSQTRLAFMAYVNNADNPTEVEFQYYRSVSSHSNNQQGDQVYVYKLNKSNGWSVTVRESYTKVVAGTGLSGNWASGAITLSLNSSATATTSANGLMSSTDKSRLDTLYADYSSALTALGVN